MNRLCFVLIDGHDIQGSDGSERQASWVHPCPSNALRYDPRCCFLPSSPTTFPTPVDYILFALARRGAAGTEHGMHGRTTFKGTNYIRYNCAHTLRRLRTFCDRRRVPQRLLFKPQASPPGASAQSSHTAPDAVALHFECYLARATANFPRVRSRSRPGKSATSERLAHSRLEWFVRFPCSNARKRSSSESCCAKGLFT